MDDMTISIMDILALLIRKGKQIILIAIVLALLLGTFKGIAMWSSINDVEAVDLRLEEYEQELLKLNREIENATQSAQKQQMYIDNSLWMQINPYDQYVANIYLAISDVDELALDMIFSIEETPLEYMTRKIGTQYHILWAALDLPVALGLPQYANTMDKYLREVVNVGIPSTGTISISALGNSEKEATELAEAACDAVLKLAETVKKNSCDHDIQVYNSTVKNQIDMDMASTQMTHYEQLDGYNDTILEAEGAIKKLDSPDSIQVAVIKNMIIGGLIGGVLACVWYCGKSLLQRRLQSSLHGEGALQVSFIGSLAEQKGVFCKIANIFLGERIWKDEEQALEYIIETLKLRAEGKTLLLATSLKGQKCVETVQKLQAALSANGLESLCVDDFARNPNGLVLLRKCDVVVLLEAVDETKLAEAVKTISFAEECNKPVLGMILV